MKVSVVEKSNILIVTRNQMKTAEKLHGGFV